MAAVAAPPPIAPPVPAARRAGFLGVSWQRLPDASPPPRGLSDAVAAVGGVAEGALGAWL